MYTSLTDRTTDEVLTKVCPLLGLGFNKNWGEGWAQGTQSCSAMGLHVITDKTKGTIIIFVISDGPRRATGAALSYPSCRLALEITTRIGLWGCLPSTLVCVA